MSKRVVCKSGLKGGQYKLHKVYASYEEFEAYDRTYRISSRLGYGSPQEAWDANPTIQSSVEPSDLCVVKAPTAKRKNSSAKDILQEFVEDVKLAYGTGRGNAIDSEALDWPDLEVTYNKALIELGMKKKPKQKKV